MKMPNSNINKPLNLHTFLRSYLDNHKGVAAIEFALIAPVMIAMYLGLSEVSMLVSVDRNVSHTASVVADLATQEDSMDSTDIENIFNAALQVMGTNSTSSTRLSMDIRSFEMDNSGTVNEVGYAKLGTGFTGKFDPSNVSSALLNATSGLVVTRIKYIYHSPSGVFVKTPTLTETFMLKPRKSKSIPFSGTPITCSISSGPSAHC